MGTICPYCNIEVDEASIELEDGCCPECGSVITASFDDNDEEPALFDEDEDDDYFDDLDYDDFDEEDEEDEEDY